MKNDIIEYVKGLLSRHSDSDIKISTRLSKLTIDSMRFVELIFFIENKYSITFEQEKLTIASFKQVKHLIDYIEERQNYNPDL